MYEEIKVCPVVGQCPYSPIKINPNHYFLIEPFDGERELRELAVEIGLETRYGKNNFELITADRQISPEKGLFCDICKKIQSCQICIADITPIKNGGSSVIKENVMLELGMAYGFQKPVLVLSQKIDGKRYIPSDLGFIRYIDIPYCDWGGLTINLISRLTGIEGIGYIKKKILPNQLDLIMEMISVYEAIIWSKKYQKEIDGEDAKVIEFRIINKGHPIAIIKNCKYLKNGMILKLFNIESGIEQYCGTLKVFHLQKSDDLAQAYYMCDDDSKDIWGEKVNNILLNNNVLAAFSNRLYVHIPTIFKGTDIRDLEKTVFVTKSMMGNI